VNNGGRENGWRRVGFQWRQGRMLMFRSNMVCFYDFQSISSMIKFDKNGHVNLIGVFPSVVTFGVTLPFDEILQGFAMSPSSVAEDLFYLIFFLAINQIRGRSGEIQPM
jgi:hypothetical protein